MDGGIIHDILGPKKGRGEQGSEKYGGPGAMVRNQRNVLESTDGPDKRAPEAFSTSR